MHPGDVNKITLASYQSENEKKFSWDSSCKNQHNDMRISATIDWLEQWYLMKCAVGYVWTHKVQ